MVPRVLLTGFSVVLGFNVVFIEGEIVTIFIIVPFGNGEVVVRLTGAVMLLDEDVVLKVLLAELTDVILGANVVKFEGYNVLLIFTIERFGEVEGVVELEGKVTFIDCVRFNVEELNVDKVVELIVGGVENRVEFIAEDGVVVITDELLVEVVVVITVLFNGFVVIVTTVVLAGAVLFDADPVVMNWDGMLVVLILIKEDEVMLLHPTVVVLDMLLLDEEMVLLLGEAVVGIGKGNIPQKNGLYVVTITGDSSAVG